MMLRIHRFLPTTRAEGPGLRACLWVQGCPIRCPGCAVPWTWPAAGGHELPVEELAQRVLSGPAVEGITFLGGEPFEQAAALAEFARTLRQAGLSIFTFTGYHLEDIRLAGRPEWDALLAVTDLLADGPYRREQTDLRRPWVGSSNQRFHFLTDRYRHLEQQLTSIPNRLEVRLQPDGQVLVNGMIRSQDLRELFGEIARPSRS